GRRHARGDRGGREGVAHLVVGPRLGEDHAADGAVLQDQGTTAVATVHLGAQLEDVALHPALVVDVAPDRRVRAGHGRRDDHAAATARVADRGTERATRWVLGG